MVLIFGGRYQGKLDYALSKFENASVFDCSADDPESPARRDAVIINCFEQWIRALVRAGREVRPAVEAFIAAAGGKAVICNDISCGIVPDDPELRRWREETGRAVSAVSLRAEEVVRLFCGIPARIK